MSPRKTILKELRSAQENGDQDYLHPSQITGYNGNTGKYQEAVNGLLKERRADGSVPVPFGKRAKRFLDFLPDAQVFGQEIPGSFGFSDRWGHECSGFSGGETQVSGRGGPRARGDAHEEHGRIGDGRTCGRWIP